MIEPRQIWWTTSELAAAALPGLPGSRQGIDRLARCDWRPQADFARRRAGKGGGWEYNWQVLPLLTRRRLLAEVQKPKSTGKRTRDDVWAWFEGLKASVKAKAETRLRILQAVEALHATGVTRQVAISEVAAAERVSTRSIYGWFQLVDGVHPADWLAYLAPQQGSRATAQDQVEVDTRFLDVLKSDYLRLERPSFSSCYRRACRIAKQQKWPICGERLARRRIEAEVPRVVQVFAREGAIGLERCFPPQRRDRSHMAAMDGVNADCHKIDVFVSWPGCEKPVRPQIIGFQDIYSGKILSWRVDWSPNKVAVMAAFGDVIDQYGIPKDCLFDNGHEFANKWMTGGAKTRFRFKIRGDEPLGVLAQLGIKVHWAKPARGQSKPIERAFLDLADEVAKDPRFAGAYVGHKPDAKPENYGSKAIPLELFLRVVEEGVIAHNARPDRRSHTAKGRSFDDTFAESYAAAAIHKATEEQRRLWLMGQEVRKLNRHHGRLTLFDNVYWSDWMNEHAGQDIVARFDPEQLHAGAYLYTKDGRYLGFAECEQRKGFFDLASARETEARRARKRKAHRKYLNDMRPHSPAELGEMLDASTPTAPEVPKGRVIRPAFGTRRGEARRATPKSEAPKENPRIETRHKALIAQFSAPDRAEQSTAAPQNDKHARFQRALRVEAALTADQPVGDAELEWWKGYRESPEYAALRRLHETFGDTMFAG